MWADDEWEATRASTISNSSMSASIGALRVALLFGSAAIAVAMLITPIMARYSNTDKAMWSSAAGVDYMETGSIGYNGSYTIRKSVLQGSPGSICVLRDNGTRSGDCN